MSSSGSSLLSWLQIEVQNDPVEGNRREFNLLHNELKIPTSEYFLKVRDNLINHQSLSLFPSLYFPVFTS